MGFADSLKKVCDKAGDKVELLVRKTALDLQSSLIAKSPVDTGRFRGNWQCGIGTLDGNASSPADKGGASAIGRTTVALSGWTPGQTIFLSNSLPYAKRLENGWSQQAPQGMVRLTVQAWRDAVQKAAASIK